MIEVKSTLRIQALIQRCCLAFCALAVASLLVSCGGNASARSSYAPHSEEFKRNIPQGEAYFQKAMAALEADDEVAAKEYLQRSLSADLYHGPAHNNLGVLYMNAGNLYAAANEFAWARKLMPGHPDPRVNLATALDAGGQRDDALAAARTALEVQPRYIPAIQVIALIQVRDHEWSKETLAFLKDIHYRGESAEWRDWAALWLTKIDKYSL